MVGHETLGDGVDGVENDEFADTGGAYVKGQLGAMALYIVIVSRVPAPSNLADVFSLWTTFAEPPSSMVLGEGNEGDIVGWVADD